MAGRFHWRRCLPYRLSAQLSVFIGCTVALAALLIGAVFTYDSVQHARDQVNQEMRFLAKNVASVSNNLILSNDLSGLEEVLLLNASFPSVEGILVVDAKSRVLSEVIKQDGQISVKYSNQFIVPHLSEDPLDVHTRQIAQTGMLDNLFPDDAQLEIWYPISAGSWLGSIRIRYSLSALHDTIQHQWQRAFIYIACTVLCVFFLLVFMLRAPMRALHQTTEFASKLGSNIGGQIKIENGTEEFFKLTLALNGLSGQLKLQQQDLADRIAQNQSILDNVIDGIITIDALGTVRSFNRAASSIFGYTLNEVLGQNIKMLLPEPAHSQQYRQLKNYAQANTEKNGGIGREVEARRKDGTLFPVDLAVSRAVDHDEVIYIGIVRDISERQRLNRLKSEFVSTVSHELRTPLTSIHGSLKLLEAGVVGTLPAGALKLVSLAYKNSQRLILLINDLLDMEKLTAGKMALATAPVDLVALVKQSILDNGGYGLTLQVQYVLAHHPEQMLVLADAGRLAQVLANLLSNAAKFSGKSHQVEISICATEGMARVAVEDHGDGIPADFQSELFTAFSQANNGNTRQQGGTGLGLKISKTLINAMQGEIGFSTRPGAGTIFWFSLPLLINH